MKKLTGIALILIFALSFVAGALVTPANAISDNRCEEICRQTYYWYCCGDKGGSEPGCVIIGRCE